jgi:hypothetical protein
VVLSIPYVLQQTFSADMVQLSPPAHSAHREVQAVRVETKAERDQG